MGEQTRQRGAIVTGFAKLQSKSAIFHQLRAGLVHQISISISSLSNTQFESQSGRIPVIFTLHSRYCQLIIEYFFLQIDFKLESSDLRPIQKCLVKFSGAKRVNAIIPKENVQYGDIARQKEAKKNMIFKIKIKFYLFFLI